MNIFAIDKNPEIAARQHNDKHCVRMILESAQLLSTAHRIVDGTPYIDRTTGRRIQRWRHPDNTAEQCLLKATHANHPCAVWVRYHPEHYQWTYCLFAELTREYHRRYHKHHAYSHVRHPKLFQLLGHVPRRLMSTPRRPLPPPQAMPNKYKQYHTDDMWSSTVYAYRQYYCYEKAAFSTWRNGIVPDWFVANPSSPF